MPNSDDTASLLICERYNSINKTIPSLISDGEITDTIHDFFGALSDYISFLRDWSGSLEDDVSQDNSNLFSRSQRTNADSLADALPVVKFKKTVEILRISINEHSMIPQIDEVNVHLKTLHNLTDMATEQYEGTHALDILEQQIILLQATLAIVPRSHPDQNFPCLKLGDALIARFRHTDELRDLDQAISYYTDAHLVGLDQYILLQGLTRCLMIRSDKAQNSADLEKAIGLLQQALSEMSPSYRYRHACLNNLGSLMMERYEKNSTSVTALQQAISYYRDALESCPTLSITDLHSLPTIISSLSIALIKSHELAGLQVNGVDVVNVLQKFISLDLDDANQEYDQLSHILTKLLTVAISNQQYSNDMLTIVRQFINLKPPSDAQRCLALNAFCGILLARFNLSKDSEDLDEAIAAYRDALLCPPPDEGTDSRIASLHILAGLLEQRFQTSDLEEDSEEIIAIYSDMLASSTSDDLAAKTMKQYADFLILRFEKHSCSNDREEALSLYNSALQLVSIHEEKYSDQFDLLWEISRTSLLCVENADEKDEQFRNCINETIDRLQSAIKLPDCNSHEHIGDVKRLLSACLLSRYEMTHDPEDLNKSAELTNDEDEQHDILSELRDTMVLDISKIHNVQELEDMIRTLRESLNHHPFPHPARSETLMSLGKALASIFKMGGSKKQLDEAILRLREAVALSPKSIIAMVTLAEVLFQKAELEQFISTKSYIDEVMDLMRQCVPLFPTNSSGLAEKLIGQAKTHLDNKDSTALDSISLIRELNLSGEKDLFESARSMAFVLWMSFTISGDMKELDESIHHAREAAMNCPEDHPQGAAVFHDLGSKLFNRYESLKDVEDLDEALHCYVKSIKILPSGNYFQCLYLGDLGIALIRKLGYLEDMSELFTILTPIALLFKAGAMESTSSPVPVRFRAAKVWALIADACNHESALEAYQQAINLLPRLSSMAANVTDRQETFKHSKIDGLSRNAALFAIRIGKYNEAIEFLEAGRAVFWLQALQLRNPMDRLRDSAQELHEKLSGISAELDKASMRMNTPQAPGSNAEKRIQDEELFRLEELNEKWLQTVEEIHQLEGFRDFLSPQDITKLQASINFPVIFLIPDEQQSHALIMFPNEVQHVDLPNAHYEKLQLLVTQLPGSGFQKHGGRFRGVMHELFTENETKEFTDTIEVSGHERGGGPRHFNHVDKEDNIKHVLKELWNDVVGPIAEALGPYATGTPLKICWCPTGIFSFLPLHAAGIYSKDMRSINSAFDYFISSYSPTVGALTHSEAAASPPKELRMMVVIDPKRLPNTVSEMRAIERHIDPDCLLRMGTPECPALVDSVAANLSNISIAHFACHGMQLTDKPLDSSLILHDGNLKISRIMEERVPNAALAFLCACETAMGDKDLPDEAMHLGATLLFSGFRGVVATMWSIDDEDGPVVADKFYAHLFNGDPKNPDTALAAEAVHNATRFLRDRKVGFERWVPFIHLGN
ncbi:CHAT domain-containing protein [Cyathus striatus]|nr:CHAT domain-containing protein [Cyathus striatus]